MNYEYDIDQYLTGKLKGSELEAFKSKLDSDAALKEEFDIAEAIHAGIVYQSNEELKQHLRGIRSEMMLTVDDTSAIDPDLSNKSKSNSNIWKIIVVVAVMGALGYIASKYTNTTNADLNTNLFAAHYEAFKPSFGTRNSMDENLAKVDEFYSNAKYKEAIPLLTSIIEKEGDNSKLLMALGNCYMMNNDFGKASSIFQSIAAKENDLFADQANWYQGLNLLKQEKIQESKKYLNKIAQNPEADFHNEAIKLLKDFSK